MLMLKYKGTTKIKMSSIYQYLQFQPIDVRSDDISENHRAYDEINLHDQIDGDSIMTFWDDVMNDEHSGSGINYSDR